MQTCFFCRSSATANNRFACRRAAVQQRQATRWPRPRRRSRGPRLAATLLRSRCSKPHSTAYPPLQTPSHDVRKMEPTSPQLSLWPSQIPAVRRRQLGPAVAPRHHLNGQPLHCLQFTWRSDRPGRTKIPQTGTNSTPVPPDHQHGTSAPATRAEHDRFFLRSSGDQDRPARSCDCLRRRQTA